MVPDFWRPWIRRPAAFAFSFEHVTSEGRIDVSHLIMIVWGKMAFGEEGVGAFDLLVFLASTAQLFDVGNVAF